MAVLTPLGSKPGASSFRSAATTLVFATVRIASRSWGKLTPPASGVPVPGKQDVRRIAGFLNELRLLLFDPAHLLGKALHGVVCSALHRFPETMSVV